jgi:hypothetical protein
MSQRWWMRYSSMALHERARPPMANVHAPELTDTELPFRCCAAWLGLRRHTSRHLWRRAWEQRTNLSA